MNTTAGAERRRFPRFPFHSRAVMRLGNYVHAGTLLDISYNGALFECPLPGTVVPGDKCYLTVLNDGGRRRGLDVRGSVVYADSATIGIQFLPLEWNELGGLMRIIELNLGTQELLSRQLGSLLEDSGYCNG